MWRWRASEQRVHNFLRKMKLHRLGGLMYQNTIFKFYFFPSSLFSSSFRSSTVWVCLRQCLEFDFVQADSRRINSKNQGIKCNTWIGCIHFVFFYFSSMKCTHAYALIISNPIFEQISIAMHQNQTKKKKNQTLGVLCSIVFSLYWTCESKTKHFILFLFFCWNFF